jgi:hypothetical protein
MQKIEMCPSFNNHLVHALAWWSHTDGRVTQFPAFLFSRLVGKSSLNGAGHLWDLLFSMNYFLVETVALDHDVAFNFILSKHNMHFVAYALQHHFSFHMLCNIILVSIVILR